VFHYIVESGLTFICMTDENFQRRTAFAFLDDIKRRWQVTFGDRGKTAPMKAMQDEFSRILQKQMDYFSNDKAADKMAAVQKDVDDVKEVMVSNIGE
jgi:vesicle-associated membrane protein 7